MRVEIKSRIRRANRAVGSKCGGRQFRGGWAPSTFQRSGIFCGELVDFWSVIRGLKPLHQFVRICEDTAASASRYAVHGQSALFFPTFDGALVAAEEGSNFLP